MDNQEASGWVTRIDRIWALAPFKKVWEKRQRETALLDQLAECLARLFENPRHPGLNLESLHFPGQLLVLSARINRGDRLILTRLARTQVGLLFFGSHDEAYSWADRQRETLPTMLTRVAEIARDAPLSASFSVLPVVQADEESPLAIASTAQFRTVVAAGSASYLTYLDEEQRRLAELPVRGLLLVKGGVGTGKTAVAVHRLLALTRQPALFGPGRVLFLCFNNTLADVLQQLIRTLSYGAIPRELEVRTFHTWCHDLLLANGEPVLDVDEDACRQAVFRAFGQLPPEQRQFLGQHDGAFVYKEIEQVIKPNGLSTLQQYLDFDRRGRRDGLKRTSRSVVWQVHEAAEAYRQQRGICGWQDGPIQALAALCRMPDPPRCRGVVVDEGQDCSPVLFRLAHRLASNDEGSLTVFADPAQAIYSSGFQWTQQELRRAGGQVRVLRRNYRSTREIFELARPLLDADEEAREGVAHLELPERHGPRPRLFVTCDQDQLDTELVEQVAAAVLARPAGQIALLAPTRKTLERQAERLREHGVPVQYVVQRNPIRLEADTVKLLTIHGAKGLDFPQVFLVGPRTHDLGPPDRAMQARRVLYVALTRASESLTVWVVYGSHHPLLELLDDRLYDVDGPCGRQFVNMRGFDRAGEGG